MIFLNENKSKRENKIPIVDVEIDPIEVIDRLKVDEIQFNWRFKKEDDILIYFKIKKK